jgi:hypothetical protein
MVVPLTPDSPVLDILGRSLRASVDLSGFLEGEPAAVRGLELLKIQTRHALDLLPDFRAAIAELWRDLNAGKPIDREAVRKKVLNSLAVYVATLERTQQQLAGDPARQQAVERADEVPATIDAARQLYQEFLDSWPGADDDAAAKRAADYPLPNDKLLAFADRQGPPPAWYEKDEDLFE